MNRSYDNIEYARFPWHDYRIGYDYAGNTVRIRKSGNGYAMSYGNSIRNGEIGIAGQPISGYWRTLREVSAHLDRLDTGKVIR